MKTNMQQFRLVFQFCSDISCKHNEDTPEVFLFFNDFRATLDEDSE